MYFVFRVMSQSQKGSGKTRTSDQLGASKKDVPLKISRQGGALATVRYAYLTSYFVGLLVLIYAIIYCTNMLRSVPYKHK